MGDLNWRPSCSQPDTAYLHQVTGYLWLDNTKNFNLQVFNQCSGLFPLIFGRPRALSKIFMQLFQIRVDIWASRHDACPHRHHSRSLYFTLRLSTLCGSYTIDTPQNKLLRAKLMMKSSFSTPAENDFEHSKSPRQPDIWSNTIFKL